jgi:hypothetical protein
MHANISLIKKFIHFFPIIPVYLIIFTVLYSFTKFYLLDHNPWDIFKISNCLLFYYSATMVIINHGLSMLISPGFVRFAWQPPVNIDTTTKEGEKLFCKQCNSKRPERAHHCKICHKCVLKMDHHCPWVANCVGFYNQKYFVLFLLYAVVGNFLAFLTFLCKVLYVDFSVKGSKTDIKDFGLLDLLWLMWEPVLLLTATIVSLGMVIAIGVLLAVQAKHVLCNTTTVESFVYTSANPWQYPDKLHNFKTVMGDKWYLWLLPVFKQNIYNNGYSYCLPGEESSKGVRGAASKYSQLEPVETSAGDSSFISKV